MPIHINHVLSHKQRPISSSPSLSTVNPYIFNPKTPSQIAALEDSYKSYLIDNLENVLIGHPSTIKWTHDLKAPIADTIIRGRFKYHDAESRTSRAAHNSTLTLGTATPTPPLPRATLSERRAAVIHEGFCMALNYLVSENAFDASSARLKEIRDSAPYGFFKPDAPCRLGAITLLIRDVATNSARPLSETVDILLTSIMGIPCSNILPNDSDAFFDSYDATDAGSHDRNAQMLTKNILHFLTLGLPQALPTLAAEPGTRWKTSVITKLAYLDKISLPQGHHIANDEVLRSLSKIDLAHALLETGVSLKVAGKKICFVAPHTLTMCVCGAIADVYVTDTEFYLVNEGPIQRQDSAFLGDEDFHVMEASDPLPEYGQWTSLFQCSFSRPTLADFISREYPLSRARVAANSHGDVMFFVTCFGPWMPPTDVSIRSKETTELLRKTVQGYPVIARASLRFRRKKSVQPVTVAEPIQIACEADKPLRRTSFEKCEYKPRTLDAVFNKQGRVLVKRRGIRGNGGRFIVAGIVALGIVAVVFNFANRDNWLEIAFDGAQVMSLVAGVAVAVVYLVNGTLTSTLDWLAGLTEVTDEKQLAKVLGASLDEVKVACTYEKGDLFWLSDVHSSFCPAAKHGTIVFSEPLDMGLMSPHVRFGSVVEKEGGLWLLQGWAFRLEKEGDIRHMVKVPYEDRVYVENDRTFNLNVI